MTVFIEEGDAFVFAEGARVIKLDQSAAYRQHVLPLANGTKCVDFLVKNSEGLTLIEAKNYPTGTATRQIGAHVVACTGKALGSLTTIVRHRLTRSTEDFDWIAAAEALCSERLTFGLVIRLPTATRASRDVSRVRGLLAIFRRKLQGRDGLRWLGSPKQIYLVEADNVRKIPGLLAVEPAAALLSIEANDILNVSEKLRRLDSLNSDTSQRALSRLIDVVRQGLPDSLRRTLSPASTASELLAEDLAALNADHPSRRDDHGQPWLASWLTALSKWDPDVEPVVGPLLRCLRPSQ